MCKQIWVEATDALEASLERTPTADEIEVKYQELCSERIEAAKKRYE
jgi:hypothetical protein